LSAATIPEKPSKKIDEVAPFTAPDGSKVREIARPPVAKNQSLAQAAVEPGGETTEHLHRTSEEIYLFVSGAGRMRLGDEELDVRPGSAVVIPPGTRHKLWSSGEESLVLYCCCSPPYSDEDTVLLET
jgi:mannose-6-phosphate isomerase-like protein (cupin superfamily)